MFLIYKCTTNIVQVRAIRTYLTKESKELANVTVESIYNVQGKPLRFKRNKTIVVYKT